MEFKVFTENDLIECTKIFIEVFNDEPWNDEWTFERAKQYITDFYHTPGFFGVLAIEKGEMIGFIHGVNKAWWSGNEFYINEMGVKQQWRNQGVGKALLEQLIKELEDSEISNFALLTNRGTSAEAFYKKNGFQEIERLVFYSRDI
ncbi:GNAT family N-acetyltransferase [Bacillus aquiflavi]|uniref:GNAT family N-acetyltransferase n=1 Tax=Bacillus aquiflavi TaxID=2672567 RepID=A0A6B3W1W7_9BACI|nr:GNAT family N-acetyltransferase [Bacillus aquiflavi]MBA4537277.1 GNAT family N-acetyltransferase [Bacillus aquiflavi]NEY81534.1 GNAT family N-acetyltransferase [Bacillus aquiflavi]UAC48689.1 GNAT family N-acetyltransferase [Bacillus aquiflavi]